MVCYPEAPQLAPHKLTSIVQAVPEHRHCRGIVSVTIHVARGCCWHCDKWRESGYQRPQCVAGQMKDKG